MLPDAAIYCFHLLEHHPLSCSFIIYPAQSNSSSAVGTLFYDIPEERGKISTSCVPTSAAAAAAARAPQPINRAAVGTAGSCCRPFDFTLGHRVSCGAKKLRHRHGYTPKKMSTNASNTPVVTLTLGKNDNRLTLSRGVWRNSLAVARVSIA